jgi:hypothetical protein
VTPEVCRPRQNAFCEREDAFYVEFFELAGVTVDPRERELLAQLLGVAVVRLDVDRLFKEEGFVQTVELFSDCLCRSFRACNLIAAPSAPDRFVGPGPWEISFPSDSGHVPARGGDVLVRWNRQREHRR